MDRRLLARIRTLELTVIGRVEGVLQGDHRGLLPGPGGEVGDARPYIPGDDVRRIDWNVTARTRTPHVRDTTADRELHTTLVVDTSASMTFGTLGTSKLEPALGAAAVFGFLTDRAGDRVGAVLAGPTPRAIPPDAGRAHVYRILSAVDAAVGGPGDLAGALERVARLRSRRGLVVVISDLLDETPWWRSLRLVADRHDTVVVEVSDAREWELPDVGVVRFVDSESGERAWVDTSDAGYRRRFAARAAARRDEVAGLVRGAGANLIRLRTDRDWVSDLVGSVLQRRRMLAASGRTG